MSSSEMASINIGDAVRGGLRLKTVDVVAMLHDACVQLEGEPSKRLPTSMDELSLNDAGSVQLLPGPATLPARAAVTELLERLLAATNDEAATPAALRTLPARLRESGSGTKTSDLRDLLTILRWHLPYDSRQMLRDLAVRAQLTRMPHATVAIDDFADEPLPAAVIAIKHTRHPLRRTFAFAAAAVVAVCASGYIAYRYSQSTTPVVVIESAAAPLPAPSLTPRIKVREAETVVEVAPKPIALAVSGGAFSPSFDAGTRTLLFHAGRNSTGRLFTATLDGERRASLVAPLLDERGRTYHARLSPDGRRLAFDSDRDGVRGVYIADREGRAVERVSGSGFAAVPSWSPDMTTLAFVRGEPGRERVWNLWQRELSSGNLARLTNFRSGQVWGASWFPDSERFAYSHEDRLIIADRAGRRQASYASPIDGRLVRTPAVSPDGSRIVFQVYRDGAWLLDVASGQMRQVLDDPSAEEFAWEPDGRHVMYHSRRDGQWRIWVMPVTQ